MGTLGAVVLTGGAGRRLGGADKAALEVDGRTLLQRSLTLVQALPHVVVGPPVPGVATVREHPPGAGPAAALLAGVAALSPEVEVVLALAVDMPHVSPVTLARLHAGATGADGALLVDGDGRRQYLCAAYQRRALLAAAPDDPDGLAVRHLVAGLRLVEVAAQGREADDVDTWDDLERARETVQETAQDTAQETAQQTAPETARLRTVEAPADTGAVNLHDWVDELCDELDIEVELDEALVLDLARDAAHNVERPAAPITTFLLGYAAARAGGSAEETERLAGLATALALRWEKSPDDLAHEDDDPEADAEAAADEES